MKEAKTVVYQIKSDTASTAGKSGQNQGEGEWAHVGGHQPSGQESMKGCDELCNVWAWQLCYLSLAAGRLGIDGDDANASKETPTFGPMMPPDVNSWKHTLFALPSIAFCCETIRKHINSS